jgi:transposase InsO family protein
MSEVNRLWSAPRIHGELLKRGINVYEATVAKYMARRQRPPSQTWRTFLANHIDQIVAADFFVVLTLTYRLLFVLVILAHRRRRVAHVAVTAHPTAAWTAQQLREAFPEDAAPRYLIHDRDHAFAALAATASGMGIEDLRTAPRSPWQNAYAERIIGSIRRECLDHAIVANETGLLRVLSRYLVYYDQSQNASLASEGLPAATADRHASARFNRGDSTGRRPAPSLRPPGSVVTLFRHCQTLGLPVVRRSSQPLPRGHRSGAAATQHERPGASAQSTSPHSSDRK